MAKIPVTGPRLASCLGKIWKRIDSKEPPLDSEECRNEILHASELNNGLQLKLEEVMHVMNVKGKAANKMARTSSANLLTSTSKHAPFSVPWALQRA